MLYLYLDESGDLGFDFSKIKTSKFFLITCLFSEDGRSLEKIIKRAHAQLKRKHRVRSGVLHCVKEKPITRQRILRAVAEQDCSIMTIYLNKAKVYTRLQDEKQVLYNYVTNILLDRIYSQRVVPRASKVCLVASQRETNRFLNDNFRSYLNNQLMSRHKVDIEVLIRSPHQHKALQLADFVSWAIFRKYEYRDDSYYNLIKGRIVEESPLFP